MALWHSSNLRCRIESVEKNGIVVNNRTIYLWMDTLHLQLSKTTLVGNLHEKAVKVFAAPVDYLVKPGLLQATVAILAPPRFTDESAVG